MSASPSELRPNEPFPPFGSLLGSGLNRTGMAIAQLWSTKAKPQTPPLYCYRRRESRRPCYHDRATRRRRLGGSCNQRLASGKFGESTIIQLSRFRVVMVPVARVLTEPHSADPCAVASDIADLIRAVRASLSPLSAAGRADAGQSRALGILATTHPHSPAYSGRASPARNCHDRKSYNGK
jgi:hypothetical protein